MRQGWDAIIGPDGVFVGMHGFGASAPYKDVYKHFGITRRSGGGSGAERYNCERNSGWAVEPSATE